MVKRLKPSTMTRRKTLQERFAIHPSLFPSRSRTSSLKYPRHRSNGWCRLRYHGREGEWVLTANERGAVLKRIEDFDAVVLGTFLRIGRTAGFIQQMAGFLRGQNRST